MEKTDTQLEKCPLCGFQFDPLEAQKVCVRCPISKNCGVYCCPNCNYQFVQESRLVGLWKRIRNKRSNLV